MSQKEEKEEKVEKVEVQEKKSSPPVQFTLLSQNGLVTNEFFEDISEIKRVAESKVEGVEMIDYTPCGKYILLIFKDKLHLLTVKEDKHSLVWEINEKGVEQFHFSPKGTYLTTFRKIKEEDEKEGEGNMIIWNVEKGSPVLKFPIKGSISTWPLFQWNDDETRGGIIMNKSLHIYDGVKMTFDEKIKSNVHTFKISNSNSILTFTKPNSGPVLSVIKYGKNNPLSSIPVNVQSDNVVIHWNKGGNAAIVLISDESKGSFYYGKNFIYFLNTSGTATPIKKGDDQIYDVQWSPKGNEFVVIHGYPPKATVYSDKADVITDYGTGSRNTILWNSFGRLICLAGLGNMNGNVEIWDRQKNKKISALNLNRGSRLSWSPCGRFLLSNTIQSRLKVENGYQIIKYNSVKFVEKEFEKLYFISWKPCFFGDYVSRPPSPRGLKQATLNEKKNEETEKKYVPPHLRNVKK